MKICALLTLLPFLALHAQTDTPASIKVTTTLHDDGSKTVTRLDPDAHTSSAETLDGGGKLRQRIVYELDDENQPASGTMYDAKGAFVLKSVYKRDPSHRIIEETDYTADGRLMRRFVYEFGSSGKVARIRAFDAEGNELQQSATRPDPRKAAPRRHR